MSNRHIIQAIVFLLLTVSGTLNAKTYTVSRADLSQKAAEIHNYYEGLTGVDLGVVYNYLNHQLNLVNGYSDQLNEPIPDFITSSEEGIIFRWGTSFSRFNYNIGYLDLTTAEHDDTFTIEPGVQICRSGYLYHMFSFTTIDDNQQSKLHIIIIDRDAFLTCNGEETFSTIGGFSAMNGNIPPSQPLQQLTASPSLIHNSTEIQFNLPESREVSLSIYELGSGRLVSRPLDSAWLDKGRQRFEVNMAGWPAGLYACTLQSAAGLETLKLIKL